MTSTRVLIVVHGHEPAGWSCQVSKVISMLQNPTIRLLPAFDVPSPPFTSLTPYARRIYDEALTYWREQADHRTQAAMDEIAPLLAVPIHLVRAGPPKGTLAERVADHAMVWPADIVIMSRRRPGLRSWFWPGPTESLLRQMTCALTITPGDRNE